MKNVAITTQSKINRFTPTVSSGLSSLQVKERIDCGLINTHAEKYSKSYFSIFVGNLCTFFNLLGLIVVIAISFAGAKLFDYVFVLVYIMNIVIGITQEIRAKKCIDNLSLLSQKNAKVIRDGKTQEISPEQIVLDEVILLSIGDQVPTDCKILDGNVEVDESVLTGESVSIKKKVGDTLLSGSFIVAGSCTVLAERVGKDNYVQKLSAEAKKYRKPHSELMESLKLMIKILGFVIIPIATAFMIKSAVIQDVNLNDAILRTATVVIGMIPSGMFLLTSLALAVGIIKLASHNTLVQDLYSLEMLARVDTICFDKTGTITDGNMTVKDIIPINGNNETELCDVIASMMGAINDKNQTAEALIARFGKEIKMQVVATLPFNSKRKLSAAEFKGAGTFSIGAPEFVLSKSEFDKIKKTVNEYASKGLRVLVLAHTSERLSDDLPKDFTAVSLILLADHIRKEAFNTVKWFKENGVTVKVISGDNPVTVAEVAARVGILNADKYVSLEGMSNEEVAKIANDYTVFGRVSPEQKAILVKSMKAAGHVTAMTGDGVNDILALKEADCAVTVASGSDAARNISHIVLLDNNFDSMPDVVFEGRRVINNIERSASLYLMKTFFTLIIAFVTLCLPFIEAYPFELRQMNLLEILIIGIPSFFLSLQPNKSRVEGKFLSYVIRKSVPSAILMALSVAIVEIFKVLAGDMFPEPLYQTLSIYALTFSGLVNLAIICYPFNKFRKVLFGFIATVLTATFIVTVCFGLPIFGFVRFVPLDKNLAPLLLFIGILFANIPLSILIQKMFDKILKSKQE